MKNFTQFFGNQRINQSKTLLTLSFALIGLIMVLNPINGYSQNQAKMQLLDSVNSFQDPDNLGGPVYIGEVEPFVLPSDNTISLKSAKVANLKSANISLKSAQATKPIWPEPGAINIEKTGEATTTYGKWKINIKVEGKNIPKTTDVVLVIDDSGSMGTSKMNAAKDAAKDFVDELLTGTTGIQIAVVTINGGGGSGQPQVDHTFSNNISSLKTAINAITANGGTNLQGGFYAARQLVESSTANRKVVILLSDGDPTYSYSSTVTASPTPTITSCSRTRISGTYVYSAVWNPATLDPSQLSVTESNYGNIVGSGTNFNISNFYQITQSCSGSNWTHDYTFSATGNHGIPTKYEAGLIMDKADVYTIGFEVTAGGNAENVLIGSQNAGYYPATSSNIGQIYSTIRSNIAYAATNAVFSDPMSTYITLVTSGATPTFSVLPSTTGDVVVSKGTVTFTNNGYVPNDPDDPSSGNSSQVKWLVTWNIGTVSESGDRMYYYVNLAPNTEVNTLYDANEKTSLNYTDVDGDPFAVYQTPENFTIPKVSKGGGSIMINYYLVNSSGQPINSAGVVVTEPQYAYRIPQNGSASSYFEHNGNIALELGTTYTVSGINPYSSSDGRTYSQLNATPQNISLTTSNPNHTVWFAYVFGCNETVNAGSDFSICEGDLIDLSAVFSGTPNSVTWTGPNSYSSTSLDPVAFTATTANSGEYTVTVNYAFDCVAQDIVKITVLKSTEETIEVSGCDVVTVNGVDYTASGSYTQELENIAGCDSTLTIIATVLKSTEETIKVSGCDVVTVNGVDYTASGSYTQELENIAGCDSTLTIIATVLKSTEETIEVSGCDVVTVNGVDYTASGSYTQELENIAGCDSTLTIIATVLKSTEETIEVTACDSYTWNGKEYTESGIFTAELINEAGCDSIATLILTITNSSEETITRTSCEPITINGITYTESGIYVQQLQNNSGCNSILTLNLTILKATSSLSEVTACDSYTWNGVEYTESGTYSAEFENAAGCDSTATLILIINNSTESSEEVTACDSYTWNGVEYTESGTYTAEFKNAAGCDSTATLVLTINNSTESSEEVTACDSYTWNGVEYTESGTYSAEFKNAAGCDSTATLILTINHFTENTINEIGCGIVVVNDVTYTESGTYTQTLTNANGCDSLLTVNVTITVCNPEMKLKNDSDTTRFNTPVTVCVKDNDSGIPTGSVLSIPSTTVLNGKMTVTAEGCVTYTPPVNFVGEDTFYYTITTAEGKKDSALVTITVLRPLDLMIQANDDYFEIVQGESLNLASIIANDINTHGDIIATDRPILAAILHGLLDINVTGVINYTPDADFFGEIQFTYRICSSLFPDLCDEAVVTINVIEKEIPDPNPLTPCDSILFIPNGFSPNDDGYNEYFEINFICQGDGDTPVDFEEKYPEAKMEIYNRWGNRVYEKEGYGNVSRWGSDAWWDGRSNKGVTIGKDRLPAATYFYILYFNDGKTEPKAGSIFLNK